MPLTAQNLADQFNIGAFDQSNFALFSHRKAAGATAYDMMKREIHVLSGAPALTADDSIRYDASLEALLKLPPLFNRAGASVTAGTSSPITDGAAITFIVSEEYARDNNLSPLARIVGIGESGCDPAIMGIGPVEASRKALKHAGISQGQVGIVELNEAFAAQALACMKLMNLDEKNVNMDGGALALGHPLGASGARITFKAAQLLQRTKREYALATMCIGGGQGIATVLQRYTP